MVNAHAPFDRMGVQNLNPGLPKILLNKICLNMVIFLEKSCKNCQAVVKFALMASGGFSPTPSRCYSQQLFLLSKHISSV